jgi:hypothetical protein
MIHSDDSAVRRSGTVAQMYEQARARFGYVPDWAQPLSLLPDLRDGCMAPQSI